MPRKGRKKLLGKRPDIEQERRADQLQDLKRELHRKQRRCLTDNDLECIDADESDSDR